MAAWTQTQRDALAATIAEGVLTVRYADKTVTYQSLNAMRSLLSEMDDALAGSTVTNSRASFGRD